MVQPRTLFGIIVLFAVSVIASVTASSGKGQVIANPSSGLALVVKPGDDFAVSCDDVVLSGENFDATVTLAPFRCDNGRANHSSQSGSTTTCEPWPQEITMKITIKSPNGSGNTTEFISTITNASSPSLGLADGLTFTISGISVSDLGHQSLDFALAIKQERWKSRKLTCSFYVIPPILSILPPVVTLILAFATQQVVPSLLIGVWVGAFLVNGYNPISSFCNTFSKYFVDALIGDGHGPVILFALVLGGVLELVDKSGGAKGLAIVAQRMAHTRTRALVAAYALSMVIFFDDYSCILIVGACLRPSLRQVRVSPAKLAFIIHIVGNNLPSFFPVSSWVGVELGYIKDQYESLGISGEHGAFSVFLRTIPYRFFPLVAILMPLLSILTGRDFGPLLDAEVAFLRENGSNDLAGTQTLSTRGRNASNSLVINLLPSSNSEEEASDDTGRLNTPTPPRAANAIVPFSILIVATFAGIAVSGSNACSELRISSPSLVDIVAHADSVNALLWAAAASSLVAVVLYAFQKLMSLGDMMSAWTTGFKDMMEPILILMLAWALGGVVKDLKTASFLAGSLNGNLNASWICPLATVLAGIVSFASGSAMGTMGILFPLILPLAASLTMSEKGTSIFEAEIAVMQAAAAVLAGSTFGNTCSPIADNTILASLSSGCDLVLHAKTMAPYTAVAFMVSLIFGTVPVSLGWISAGVGVLLCCGVIIVILYVAGKDPQKVVEQDQKISLLDRD